VGGGWSDVAQGLIEVSSIITSDGFVTGCFMAMSLDLQNFLV
jgi:hypothetical protein